MDDKINSLIRPTKLWSRSEVLGHPCPVPAKPGVYAWFFKEIPPLVPLDNCVTWQNMTLLYVGISPKKSTNVKERNLRTRIKTHIKRNAEGSTLRYTLGCLLRNKLGIKLYLIGKSKRKSFREGETILSEWMSENAFVNWSVLEEPWNLEKELIERLNPPLNLMGNKNNPFYPTLSQIRKSCRQTAIRLDHENG